MVCSLLPSKSAWLAVGVSALAATCLGGSAVLLGSAATYRCLSALQEGCIQTSPASVIALLLGGINVLLNAYQCWSTYLILQFPSFTTSSTQRIRILFSWILPFGWLINAVLLFKSRWTIYVAIHIMIDPTIIIMANSRESGLLLLLIAVTLASDAMAFVMTDVPIVSLALMIQIGMTACSGLLILMPKSVAVEDEEDEEDEEDVVAEVVSGKVFASEARFRQKSSPSKIKF